MRKEIDPNLKQEWEAKLAGAGLPEITNQEEVPVQEASATETNVGPYEMLSEALQGTLAEFAGLPEKIKQDIIGDVKTQQQAGRNFKEITERLKILVQKGNELDHLTPEDSDKYYNPKPTAEDEKLREEEKIIVSYINKLIELLEKIKYKSDNEEDDNKTEPLPGGWVN